VGAGLAATLAVARIYVTIPTSLFTLGQLSAAVVFLSGVAAYLFRRSGAYVRRSICDWATSAPSFSPPDEK
jgi:hypothetical protein